MQYAALIVTLAYDPWIASAAFAPRWWILGVAAVALILTLGRIRVSPGHILGALFIGWCAASVTWSVAPFDTADLVIELLIIAGIFCVAAEMESLDRCWEMLAIGIGINGLLAIFQWYGVYLIPATTQMAAGTFLNKDFLAEAAAPVFIVMVYQRKLALAALLLPALLIPQARETLLVFAAVVAFAALNTRRVGPIIGVATLGALAASVIVWDTFYGAGRAVSVASRLVFWQIAVENLTWTGFGLGAFTAMLPAYEYVHNEYLQFAFEIGIGIVPLLGLFWYALGGRLEAERLALLSVLVSAFVYFPFHEPVTAMVVALAAGRLCGDRLQRRYAEHGWAVCGGSSLLGGAGWRPL